MSSPVPEIKDLELLLRSHLKANLHITNSHSSYLTAPGENYGSIMLALNLELEAEDKQESNELKLVAKLIPQNEVLQAIFNVQQTMKKELNVYAKIVPTLEEIEDEFGIKLNRASKLFIKFYGGRSNLKNENDSVDTDAVMLFENLKPLGYINEDRLQGFNYERTVFILKQLARFHATPIAVKLSKPDVYKSLIKPVLFRPKSMNATDLDAIQASIEGLTQILKQENDCFDKKIDQLLAIHKQKLIARVFVEETQNYENPFVTFCHGDFWTNNIMVLKDHNGKPLKIKIYDFQLSVNQSAVYDLLFFIYSSVAPSILYDNVDEFIKIYYDSLISCLDQFEINLDCFSWLAFIKEIKANALEILSQIIGMYKHILLERSNKVDLGELDEKQFYSYDYTTDNCKKRMTKSLSSFIENGWI